MLSFEEKCNNYTVLLHAVAKEKGCFFEEESCEGHDLLTDTLYLEDVAGWLIPLNRRSEFNCTDRNDARWNDYFCFAEWRIEKNVVVIEFKKYNEYTDDFEFL